jgi:hypothetical protein
LRSEESFDSEAPDENDHPGAMSSISAFSHDEQFAIWTGDGTRSPRPLGLGPGKQRVMAAM